MRLAAVAFCCLAIRPNSLAATSSNNLAATAHTSLAAGGAGGAGGDDQTTTLHNSIKEIATGVDELSVWFVDNI
jgi:hypothetical protein